LDSTFSGVPGSNMSKMWLLRHKKGRSSHNCCLYQFFKIYFENKILKNENFDHPEKNKLFCLQTNLFVKNSFYMTINDNINKNGGSSICYQIDITNEKKCKDFI